MRIVFPQDDGIFQKRCHTAASVRAWFEEHQDEFTVLPLPANSPDLNPIEHVWYHLDRVVRAMDPQPRSLAQLATALESAWLNIPENTFRESDSLPASRRSPLCERWLFWLLTDGHINVTGLCI
ncbi:transposable element Tcb1 transposase [Trichonephila clavipes]|nr:transposable element Tcb1 transposase [Trichonephila clavipes]